MASRILLVEDDPGLRFVLTDRLESEGYAVEGAADGEEGFQRASDGHFDLVILDVMLPGRSGLDVCRDLRRNSVGVPILLLTARAQVVDRVVGLRLGADDYLTKPFEMAELLARVEARLRARGPVADGQGYRFGPFHVDFRGSAITREGRPVELAAKEFQLLRYFIEHRNATLGREQLLNEVWGYDAMPATRTVDVHVAGLRRKLESNPRQPQFILTLHGLGYKFVG